MPELPEVETVARQLAPCLIGRSVRRFQIVDPLLRNGRTPAVRGRSVLDVCRSGKRVLIELSGRPSDPQPIWLAVHLRMTGRLLWIDPDASVGRPRHRARFLTDRGELLFVDTRRFGTFSWYRTEQDAAPEGLDPLGSEFTPRRLEQLMRGSSQGLKAWLLRQDRLTGLGNIYAAEILYSARLSPFRPAGSLDGKERKKLHASTRRILERAIRNCGTTFSDFQDAHGVEGSYQQYLAVYDREDRPCRRCRKPITRVVQQQRSTYFCPGCQV